MTKDTIVFGGLAGIIGNIPKEVITWGFYFSGFLNYTFVHFCVGMVVNPATYVKDPLSIVVGVMIDYTIAASFSIALYLGMRKTGTDYWLLKGLGFGMIVFLICYGVLRPTFSIKIESPPLVVLMYIIPNLAYGVTTCWFLKKYGTFKVFGK
jgi:hypothetical protein